MMNMTDRNRQRIRRIRGLRSLIQLQQPSHHKLHLFLGRETIPHDGALDRKRRILRDSQPAVGRSQHGHAPHLTQLQRALGVGGEENLFNRDHLRLPELHQRGELGIHLCQPHRGRIFFAQLHRARAQIAQLRRPGLKVHLDHAVARKLRPAIDAEHPHSRKSNAPLAVFAAARIKPVTIRPTGHPLDESQPPLNPCMMPATRTLANATLACTLVLAALPGLSQTATPMPAEAPKAAPAATPKLTTPPVTTVPSLAATPATLFNRGIILLDPAHGGLDSGSRISDSILEKDVTLNLAFKLRSLLSARGFSVVMTRDSDAATPPGATNPLTLDDRAGTANRAHPVACLLLHATAAGSGVHLYSSELDPTPGEPLANPWLTAQAPWVTQSERLQKQLGLALTRAGIPLVNSRASVRPVDSLTCPALVIELAPQGGDTSTLNDSGYQQHVAEAIASALVFWKGQAQQPARLDQPPLVTTTPPPAPGAKP